MSSTSEESVVSLSSVAASVPPPKTRRRRRLAGYAVILGALLGVGSLYGLATAHGSVAAVGDPTQQVALGKSLFLQGCSSCHGLAAEGGPDAPSLIGVGSAAVDFQVSTGRMPLQQSGAQAPRKPVRYTPAEISALAAYIGSVGPGPDVPTDRQYTPTTKSDAAIGGVLFRTNCSACHNFTGEGGALAYGKEAPSLRKASDKQIYEAMITGPGTMPIYSDKQLTPDEKKDVIAFVQGMKTTPDPGGFNLGRQGAVAEGLIAFLAGMLVLTGVAVWIGTRARKAA